MLQLSRGSYEDIRGTRSFAKRSGWLGFQNPCGRGSDAEKTPPLFPGGIDHRGRFRWQGVMFGMHPVKREILRFDRLEGSGTHMQGQESMGNSRENLLREMKSRRRGRHGSRISGEDGLVSLPVRCISLSPEVRGDRHISMPLEVGRRGEFEQARTVNPDVNHRGCCSCDRYLRAGTHSLSWSDQGGPPKRCSSFEKENLDFSRCIMQPCGNYPAVVQHHQIVLRKILRKISETPVFDALF